MTVPTEDQLATAVATWRDTSISIDAIAAKTERRVCFLACDPVTFARDANRLLASGWRLSTLDLLDLFPNTHHVETLSSFERAG